MTYRNAAEVIAQVATQAKVAEAQLAGQRSSTAMAFSEDQPNIQQVRLAVHGFLLLC